MIPIKAAISYFRDCYRLDTRTVQLSNFFGHKVEQRLLFTGKERLLTGELPYIPIPDDIAVKMQGTLKMYSKEKVLYYCSFFIVGYETNVNGAKQRVCAPLFLHEAELFEEAEGYAVRVDLSKRILNHNPLATQKIVDDDIEVLINSAFESEEIRFDSMSRLSNVLTKCYSELQTDDLLMYPLINDEREVKRLYKQKGVLKSGFKIIPASGLALFRRSANTQGIMTELGEMARMPAQEYPDSIRTVFGHRPKVSPTKTELGYVPALLSDAQEQILKNASEYNLSIAIGPPGTGKSFTIASLAIEFLSRGKSVLIVSKTDQAVDVIDGKIQKDLSISNATVRAGKRDYLKTLKNRLEGLLKGFRNRSGRDFIHKSEKQIEELKTSIDGCYQLARDSKSTYEGLLFYEDKWSTDLSSSSNSSIFQKLKLTFLKWMTSLKEPHWVVVNDYMHALTTKVDLIRKYIDLSFERRIKQRLVNDRSVLRGFLSAIRARTSSRRESLFSSLNFKLLFDAFPIWLCKLSDLQKVLPFRPELFDVVIIDEATQCDIASCLPAIYRGKNVVIVGDPKQLSHVSFLSMSTQDFIRDKHGLTDLEISIDYRNLNILDFVDNALVSQNQLTLLDEHYRSLPDLIRFSNEHFYEGSMKIMNVIPEDHSKNNIEHIEVSGIRNSKGINEKESERIIKDLQLIVNEERDLSPSFCRSIGILSPFRSQVDYLNKQLLSIFTLDEIDKHDLLCGTAHSFQGEERDVMLLSFCVDNNSHPTSFLHLDRPDIFNVSVTRAKSRIKVYTSFELSQLKKESHIRSYLEYAKKGLEETFSKELPHDSFLKEVKKELLGLDFRVKVGYEVADLSLDLAVIIDKQIIAIDLIGYPGYFKDGLALTAYKVLHRSKILTFPLPYSFWKFEKNRSLKALIDFLRENTK